MRLSYSVNKAIVNLECPVFNNTVQPHFAFLQTRMLIDSNLTLGGKVIIIYYLIVNSYLRMTIMGIKILM